jgi:hypothetical protein
MLSSAGQSAVMELYLVWPTRVRHRELKHAFEEALDEAGLQPDGDLEDFVDAALSSPVQAPAVGSLGDITVASGYVAQSSLARAYEDDGPEEVAVERPSEAARKMKALLDQKPHTASDLARLRRRFAAQNHPDKVVPDLRDEAVAAMADVNASIDQALKRARAG